MSFQDIKVKVNRRPRGRARTSESLNAKLRENFDVMPVVVQATNSSTSTNSSTKKEKLARDKSKRERDNQLLAYRKVRNLDSISFGSSKSDRTLSPRDGNRRHSESSARDYKRSSPIPKGYAPPAVVRGRSPPRATEFPSVKQHPVRAQERKSRSLDVKPDKSRFSRLAQEIVLFQKMVSELEALLEQSADSPDVQWRSRILISSAEEADADIASKLYDYEKSLVSEGRKPELRTAQTACMKLHRDFRRIHRVLEMSLHKHQRRQQADIAMLTKVDFAEGEGNEKVLEEEDFFERAMRAREEEVKQINTSMHKVNEIYQELAEIVEVQQENVDKLGDNIDSAKTAVGDGLRHIEYARDRLCGPIMAEIDTRQCGIELEDNEKSHRFSNDTGEHDERFDWARPFDNFQEDFKSVKKDFEVMKEDLLAYTEAMRCVSLVQVDEWMEEESPNSTSYKETFDDDDSEV